ncbi:MAG: class I SAM-dependent methyltransferase [Myxococcales bacterium]|nr:class I SAM-dependent methyltransferase [Myxococcales bacterium]MCB9646783.1 class I SAM-dependent methyltransferase [Deltaproteobacteria bacterium]
MGFWSEAVLPRLVDWGMNSEGLGRHRARALVDVRGRVLEVGFGSGLNLPHYPEGVEAVVGVEPSVLAHRLAARRIEAAPFPVELIPLEGEKIPCADHAFDVAVSTFSLCTIPGVQDALQQIRRVLKPGGRFVFLEHGRAPDAAVARWQDRWNPTWSCMFGGCQTNREIDRLVAEAGFEVERLDRYYIKGPKFVGHFYRGTARSAG